MRYELIFLPLCWAVLASVGQAQPMSANCETRIEILPGPLSIRAQGALVFENAYSGLQQTSRGIESPTIEVRDARGVGTGWQVTVQSTDFQGSSGGLLPASSLIRNGLPGNLDGPSGSLPKEVSGGGNLSSPLTLLSTSSSPGVYRYSPNPGSFELNLPAEVNPGVYRGQLILTVLAEP
ncbi:hypothetical protein JST97_13600 [bacterium]|nr:hypothetical protein [bacterium]